MEMRRRARERGREGEKREGEGEGGSGSKLSSGHVRLGWWRGRRALAEGEDDDIGVREKP